MKVLRLHGAKDLRLHEEPKPVPGPGESLIGITAVGLCGSDLHWFSETGIGDAQLIKPLILGHEFAGEIAEGERCGERVAVDPAISCGECDRCREGNPNLCPTLRFAGHGVDDGALCELIAWPDRCLHPLPESLTDTEGVMLEPLGVAIHAVDLGCLRSGMRVGVFGCGPIGLLIIQLARIMGAIQIVATDKLTHRLEAARVAGATEIFKVNHDQRRSEIWNATDGEGVDVAFEVAGENEAVETAISSAKPGASVILVGIPDDDRTSFQASVARRKGLTIKLCRRMKHTYPRAIHLVESGLVEVRSLVTHTFSIDEYEQAFEVATRRDGLKVIIRPSQSKH